MIPLAVPDLRGNERKYLATCIDSSFVSSIGPFVDSLEVMIAEQAGSRYAVALSSGTAALHVALVASGVLPGDLVLLPSFTFIASANAIRQAGAEPWLFDVSAESWTLDPELVRKELLRTCRPSRSGPLHAPTGRRVGAIMPVHALGHPANMSPLVNIGLEWSVPVVADGAAALGCEIDDVPLGRLCTTTTLSFNGNKTVTCGGGGAVVTNDLDIADRVRHLSTTARRGPGYMHDALGFNYRMTNLQAAVGCAQMERFDKLLAAKRRIARRYRASFDSAGVVTFPEATWAVSANWMSGISLGKSPVSITSFTESLQASGCDGRAFWIPMHRQVPYSSCLKTDMSVTETIWDRLVALPCSSGLLDEEQDFVIETALGLLGF